MLQKFFLPALILAEETTTEEPKIAPPPKFGAYTETTAESYDHEDMHMVWISFPSSFYASIYYKGDEKNEEITEAHEKSITSIFGAAMEGLVADIESMINTEYQKKKDYHVVFFDSKEYKDHAVEGLNCKVDTDLCASVLLPLGKAADGEDMPEETVYTKALSVKEFTQGNPTKLKEELKEIVDLVKIVENEKSTERDAFKFTPSFDDEDSPPGGEEDDDEGFGSDDEVKKEEA